MGLFSVFFNKSLRREKSRADSVVHGGTISKDLDELKKTIMILADKIEKIGKHVNELSREVSRLSDVYGFIIEDTARAFLPSWLLYNMDIEVPQLSRAFFIIEGKYVEVDFYGTGYHRKTGEKVIIIGEAKSRVHREDVTSFAEKVEKIMSTISFDYKVVTLIYGLYIHPSAFEEITRRNITLVSPYTVMWNRKW